MRLDRGLLDGEGMRLVGATPLWLPSLLTAEETASIRMGGM